MMEQKIGFIGLGAMGIIMAKNLVDAGYKLQVYNRTASKIDELGGTVIKCKTPAEAAANVVAVITMLSDDDAVKEVTNSLLQTLPKNAVHISMSTISPEVSEQLASLHAAQGNNYIAATVFGRPEAAAAKKLWICVSGNSLAKEAAKPILENLGQGIFDFGETAGGANVVKIAGNFMILSSLEIMAEAYTLAEKNGLDRKQVSDFFSSTLFSAPIFQNYGKLIASKQYEPVGFKTKLGYKDARLTFKLAQQSEIPMPVAGVVHNRLLTAIAQGGGEQDWIEGVSRGVTDDAGV
ncbi:MAG: NAD(P)-dependent oxidoreductase [Mucilaginibacter sp.]